MVTVLNVDDNPASRYARSQVLRQAGYEVVEAESGEEAIAKVNEIHPALVLLDVNLPDISGLDVCRRIKSHPRSAAIPVLHMSASAVGEEDLISGLQAADAYVVEPVQPEILLAFVRALLRGSELLRQWVGVFDALADGVALLNAEGNVLRCNSTFCKLLGKRIAEVVGKRIDEVISGADCDPRELPFPRSKRSQQSETIECGYGDKTYRFSSHLALVRGNVAGAIYIIADVTEEVRAERDKEEAFTLLRAMTDAAPLGFAFLDADLRYRLVNKELARINSLPVEAHMGRTPEEIVPARAAEIRRIFRQVVETGQPVLDHQVNEQARSWSESWYPVRSGMGRLIGVGVTISETTEQKRAEQARQDLEKRMQDAQKLESIGLLAGGIAHDFNNLLTGILGNASLAREVAPPGTTISSCLEDIVKASERAAHLTMQMLAYSGKGQVFVENIDLSAETEDVVRLVQSSISQRISLYLDLPKDLPPVRADKGQLQQVVMNIVVNAAEAIGDNPGLLRVQTGLRNLEDDEIRTKLNGAIEPGPYVYLDIRDTGCGMDEATREKIFDPFFTTKFTGRGLGLAAVGGIVRAHKGAIHVTSAPGEGSRFAVYFPATTQKRRAAPVHIVEEGAVQKTQACRTVLVVDDEQMILRTARNALQRHGCSVLVAESGVDAIDLFQQHADDVSIIILDLSMPGMSGLEVLPELRRVRQDVPVLITSGYSEAETLRLFAGHKISGFLQKPYTSRKLVERVESAVAK
jgi:PAS domain S-box-containing protein